MLEANGSLVNRGHSFPIDSPRPFGRGFGSFPLEVPGWFLLVCRVAAGLPNRRGSPDSRLSAWTHRVLHKSDSTGAPRADLFRKNPFKSCYRCSRYHWRQQYGLWQHSRQWQTAMAVAARRGAWVENRSGVGSGKQAVWHGC